MKQELRQELMEDSLLKFDEAMAYLRVSRSTLYRLMWAGQLTGHKVGCTWRFYREDLRTCVGVPVTVPSYFKKKDDSSSG